MQSRADRFCAVRGRENQIASGQGEFGHVRFERSRIGGEIFPRRELRRVDENRQNDLARVFFCFINKGNMAGMKRAHGRHKADRLARAPPFREPRPETRHVMDNFDTACVAGGHELALFHAASVVIQRIEGASNSLIAVVDIGAGSSYPVR